METPTPVAPASRSKGFLQRELNGATFLTLEHVGHMTLVVVVTGLIYTGITSALSMWFGGAGMSAVMMGGSGTKAAEGTLSLGIVAALVVLVPTLFLLDRRTRAEWHKRPGYAGRLAYKAPVYTALAALVTLLAICKIQLLYVILMSLALIGVQGASIGSLYVEYFVPALLGVIVFAAAGWYVFTLAKGRDHGRTFSLAAAVLAAAVAIALFITTVVVLHDVSSDFAQPATSTESSPIYNDEDYYRDLLQKYYQ